MYVSPSRMQQEVAEKAIALCKGQVLDVGAGGGGGAAADPSQSKPVKLSAQRHVYDRAPSTQNAMLKAETGRYFD